LPDAPDRDATVVGAGDPPAVLAEVEVGDRARVRPELADLAVFCDDDCGLADGSGDGPGGPVRGEMVDLDLPAAAIAEAMRDVPEVA